MGICLRKRQKEETSYDLATPRCHSSGVYYGCEIPRPRIKQEYRRKESLDRGSAQRRSKRSVKPSKPKTSTVPANNLATQLLLMDTVNSGVVTENHHHKHHEPSKHSTHHDSHYTHSHHTDHSSSGHHTHSHGFGGHSTTDHGFSGHSGGDYSGGHHGF